ncbi:hypothetical protein QZH41_006360 [Actinostola sp. cb2023]|nr:hypothetical protein QZH41_006360 [Actinostola sp. cb2023]
MSVDRLLGSLHNQFSDEAEEIVTKFFPQKVSELDEILKLQLILSPVTRYFVTRGKIVSKVVKYPHLDFKGKFQQRTLSNESAGSRERTSVVAFSKLVFVLGILFYLTWTPVMECACHYKFV